MLLCGPRHDEGFVAASFDKLYGGPMNFLQNQGFSSHGCNCDSLHLHSYKPFHSVLPRIACWVVLNECPDAFNLIGPDCSSWGLPARSTSMRSSINPFGRMGIAWVSSNYCLVSRPINGVRVIMYTELGKCLHAVCKC